MSPLRRRRAVCTVVLALLFAAAPVVTRPTVQAGSQTNTNSCQNSAVAGFVDYSFTLSGTADPNPATLTLDQVFLSGGALTLDVTPEPLVAGYNLGLLDLGANTIPASIELTLLASNTFEGSQTIGIGGFGTTTITDPDGTPGTGDEGASPLVISEPLPVTVWTPSGGDIEFADGGNVTRVVLAGAVEVVFTCYVGTTIIDPVTNEGIGYTPADPIPFETVTVLAAPSPPVCLDKPVSVAAGQSTTIDLTDNCTDINDNIDPATYMVSALSPASPTGGTLTPTATPGVYTYDAPDASPGTLPAPAEPSSPVSGSRTYLAQCSDSVTPAVSELQFVAVGTVPSSVSAGSVFSVTDQDWQLTLPASLFQTALNLGLLSPGDTVTGTAGIVVAGSRTTEGAQLATNIAFSFVVEVDSSGQALPPTVPIAVPDQTWTAQSGSIDISFTAAEVSVDIGLPLPVIFSCAASTTDPYVSTFSDAPAGLVVFTFTVADTGGLVSNTATVTIEVLPDRCDATAGGCELREIIIQSVVGTTMTMDKQPGQVLMSTVVLNGQPQVTTGALRSITVTNARGTAAGWDVTGYVTDIGAPGSPTIEPIPGIVIPACTVAGSLGLQPVPDRLCIPGDNLGWGPAAQISHDRIAGDVAHVVSGPAHASDGADWLAQLIAAGASPPTSTVPTTTLPGTTTTTIPATTTTLPGTTTTTIPATTTTLPGTTTTLPGTTTTTIPGPTTSGSRTYLAECSNSVTPEVSELEFTASGTVRVPVASDATFTVSNQQWQIVVPASVFQTGLSLGLLSPGDIVHGTATLTITGSGTTEGTTTASDLAFSVTVQVDGFGQALPATIALTVPDQTWTARTGSIDFVFDSAVVAIDMGLPLPVAFSCDSTSSNPYLSTVATATGTTAAPTPTTAPSTANSSLVVPGVDGLGGLQATHLLCRAPTNQSGGTFQCDATLWLGVPASAGAGAFTGAIVLTLT